MKCENIVLNIDYSKAGLEHSGEKAFLTTYILDHDQDNRGDKTRPFILICPGGGYSHLSFREGEPIAIKMNSFGYNAAVLKYSLTPNIFPTQLLEAAAAIRIIREHANEWHVDLDNLVIAGFSAGGHVAGSLGTMWNKKIITQVLGGKADLYKPAKQLLCYPVITAGEYAHRGSFECLINDKAEMYDEVSLEKVADKDTVPTFIWHTFSDGCVPVENSLMFVSALRKNKIPCEFHMFERGGHGLALATEETNTLTNMCKEYECSIWPELFKNWIER